MTAAGPDWGAEPTPPQPLQPADAGGPAGRPGSGGGPADPVAVFPNFESWVIEWLVPTIRRPLRGGVLWCPQWWRHDEACLRLDALWRAWETARAEGGAAMSYWWEMHFDAQWAALTSDLGPFAACKDQIHNDKLTPLPCDFPPEDWMFLHPVDNGAGQ